MLGAQCNALSKPEHNPVGIKGKQSVSLDFYDMETAFMLKRVLDKLCNKDDVRLTVYGSNLYHIELQMTHDESVIMNRVCKGLCRICTRVAPTSYKSDFMKACDMVE